MQKPAILLTFLHVGEERKPYVRFSALRRAQNPTPFALFTPFCADGQSDLRRFRRPEERELWP